MTATIQVALSIYFEDWHSIKGAMVQIKKKNHLSVEWVYFEFYDRIDIAFCIEKQVQGWSRKKKEVLIEQGFGKLSPKNLEK